MGLCCSELGKALQKWPLQEFVPGQIPVRTSQGQKSLTGISGCLCCFCCSMHTSLGKCGMVTTGRLSDHCTQLSNCKNPLAHHTQCQYTRGGHVPHSLSNANTPVVATPYARGGTQSARSQSSHHMSLSMRSVSFCHTI